MVLLCLMSALGNVLGLISIPIVPGVVLNLAHLPALITATSLGARIGAIVGALTSLTTLYMVYFVSGYLTGLFIPLGGAILCAATGLASKRFRPLISCIIGEAAEQPFILVACYSIFTIVLGMDSWIALAITLTIMGKAWIDVLVSAMIIELLASRSILGWIRSYSTT